MIQVDCLRQLTKEDVISFFKQHISGSETRRKLSCHVVSMCEGGAGTCDQRIESTGAEASRHVKDIVGFKSSLPLYPLSQPFVDLESLKRPQQP